MTIASKDLEKISQLAYLDTDLEHAPQLVAEINSIMDFVDQLLSIDTSNVTPLVYPLAHHHQRLRPDVVTEENCLAELEALAPLFEHDLYLVPQVVDQGK